MSEGMEMDRAREIAEGLSAEEQRALRRSAKRHWRWPWQRVWLVPIRLPAGSLDRLRTIGLYERRGDVNNITKLGRKVAALLPPA